MKPNNPNRNTMPLSLNELRFNYIRTRAQLDKLILQEKAKNTTTKQEMDHLRALENAAVRMDSVINDPTKSFKDCLDAVTNFEGEANKKPISATLQYAVKAVIYSALALIATMLAFSLVGLIVAGQAAAVTALIGLVVGAVKGASLMWGVSNAALGSASAIFTLGLFTGRPQQETPLNNKAHQTAEIAKDLAEYHTQPTVGVSA